MGLARDFFGGIGTGLATLVLFTGAPLLGMLVGAPTLEQEILVRASDGGAPVFLPLPVEDEASEAAAAVESIPAEAAPAKASPTALADVAPPAPSTSSGARRPDLPARASLLPEKPRKGRRTCQPAPIPEIVHQGGTLWTVDRSLVKTYTSNLGKLDELGWSKQHDGPDGKPDGMLIGGVRCNNDLHRAGLRSGDVVHSVNGHAVKSIPSALFAYMAVKNDRTIRVLITRDGKRQTLAYRLTG
jgi:hypothetical protein